MMIPSFIKFTTNLFVFLLALFPVFSHAQSPDSSQNQGSDSSPGHSGTTSGDQPNMPVNGQEKAFSCAGLHSRVFYCYPQNSDSRSESRWEGEWDHEKDLVNGDTILWRVKWLDNCSYSLQYTGGGRKQPKETMEFLREHALAYKVVAVTDSFFVYNMYFDKTSNLPIAADTAWFHPKANPGNRELYRRMTTISFIRKEHFRDTSKYAILYVYRPGKLTNSLADYMLYGNDNFLCLAKNKTGYIFKILKEGPLKITSRLYKDESATTLDVKFGKVYYVKSMIHWTISKRLYNFKLEMKNMEPDKGETEFGEVTLQ